MNIEMTLGRAFGWQMAKQGVSLPWIAERLTPALKGDARAASKSLWTTLGGKAQGRGELRDLVHERLRVRGRFGGETHEIDHKLLGRVKKDPAAFSDFQAAQTARNEAVKKYASAEEALAGGFADELEKMGVSLGWIAKRMTPGLTGEARAASGKAWEMLGSQAQNRGELRDLVKERLRQRGRISEPSTHIDATLYKRLRKNPELNEQYHAAVTAKTKAMAPPAVPAAAVAAAPAPTRPGSKALKTMAGVGLAGAGVGYLTSRDKNAMANGFSGELGKLAEMEKIAPFKSEAQRRKFYALKSKGKMDQKTINEWESETPANLPERVKKTAEDKTALEKATILGAIFRRAFKGKVPASKTTDMAGRFLETAKSMDSEPSRTGLRKMIQQVKTTGTI